MNLDEAIAQILAVKTNGANYDIFSDDIIEQLKVWSTLCQFEVLNAAYDSLHLRFSTLPDDMKAFCANIYEFCPDTIDQGYGLFEEILDGGGNLPDHLASLLPEMDFNDPNCGLILMQRDIEHCRELMLWWD